MAKELNGCPKCQRVFRVNYRGLVPIHSCMFVRSVDGVTRRRYPKIYIAKVGLGPTAVGHYG